MQSVKPFNPPATSRHLRAGSGGQKTQQGILLMHGLGGSPAELQPLHVELRAAGYKVSSPVLEGLGGGTDLECRTTWQDWVDTALSHYDALAESCDTIHVAGFCSGALLAPLVAQARAETMGNLVLIAPTFVADGWAVPRSFRLFGLVTQRWFARLFTFHDREPYGIKDARIRTIVRQTLERSHAPDEHFFEVNGVKMMEFNRLARAADSSLPQIRASTLVVHAREDDISSLSNAERIARKIGGRVEMRVIPDCFHEIILDRNRSLAIQSILAFLQSKDAGLDELATQMQAV